jgi:hypothetical protein
MVCDDAEHVPLIRFGIDAIELAGFDQAIDRGGSLSADVGSGEVPVLPAQRDAAQRALTALLSISSRPSSQWRQSCLQRERA